jgi:hypothetical protein
MPRPKVQRKRGVDKDGLAKTTAPASGVSMSTALVTVRQKKASRRPRTRPAKPRNTATRVVKLELDAEELALHAAISAAVARDLGR